MANALISELRSMDIPFFALKQSLILESDHPETTSEPGNTKLSRSELVDLQRRMLGLLEDLCKEWTEARCWSAVSSITSIWLLWFDGIILNQYLSSLFRMPSIKNRFLIIHVESLQPEIRTRRSSVNLFANRSTTITTDESFLTMRLLIFQPYYQSSDH